MIKVLASKALAFSNGQAEVVAKVGFCELPDWVEQTDYYKMAVDEGSLKPFKSSAESEEVLKEVEQIEADKKKKAK